MISIGDLRIDRVEELCGAFVGAHEFLADVPDEALARNEAWLALHGMDLASGKMITSVHSWIVRTGRHTILIDTCYGNHKTRLDAPPGHQLALDWLGRLAKQGLQPEDIDYVMCTHLHVDHVGWNTRLVDGRWVPTFPNARYILSRTEYEHWHPDMGAATFYGESGSFADSVLPCVEAGQVDLVDDGYDLGGSLTMEAAPGHTAGTCVIRASSRQQGGLFVGDCMHSPLQVVYPDVNSMACEDGAQARATRRRLLADCAEHGHMLLPAHFPPPFVGHVRAAGDSFEYIPLNGDHA